MISSNISGNKSPDMFYTLLENSCYCAIREGFTKKKVAGLLDFVQIT